MEGSHIDFSLLQKEFKKILKTLDSNVIDPSCAKDDYVCIDRSKKKKVTDLIRTTRKIVGTLKHTSNGNVDIIELGELEAILVKALKNNDILEATEDLHRVMERLERFYQ